MTASMRIRVMLVGALALISMVLARYIYASSASMQRGTLTLSISPATSSLNRTTYPYGPDLLLEGEYNDGLGIFRRNAVGNNLVIFTVASSSYLSTLKDWLNAPAFPESKLASAPINVTVVCTDAALKEELFQLTGRTCHLHDMESDGGAGGHPLFVRWAIAEKLSRAGFDILYSDADAFWMSDPIPTVMEAAQMMPPGASALPQSSFVSSRGAYPFDLVNLWGATVCTGFFLIRGAMPPQFWSDLKSKSPGTGNDQDSINEVLHGGNLRFGHMLKFKDSTSNTTDVGSAFDGQLAVALLPHRTFPRMCKSALRDKNTAIVLHCLSVTGDASSKRLPNATIERRKQPKPATKYITAGEQGTGKVPTVLSGSVI